MNFPRTKEACPILSPSTDGEWFSAATADIRDFKQTALQLIEACKILSIISPLLADHVLREAEMALMDLKIIQAKIKPC